MARRHGQHGLAVSLFPFLSILACVIGTLALMIAALALGELASTAKANPGAIDAASLTSIVADIEESSRRLSELLERARQRAALQQELERMGFEPEMTADRVVRQIEDRERLADLERGARRRQAEIAALEATARVLESEARQRALPPDDAPVQILPQGSGPPLAPYFVECRGDGVRIRRRDGSFSETWNLDDLVYRGRFKVFLEEVRVRGSATAIFLVRPDGVQTFERAELLATSQFVRYGKLAIPGQGPIDFRLYDASATGNAAP